jgi:hypothetical protein
MKEERGSPERSTGAALVAALAVLFLALARSAEASEREGGQEPAVAASPHEAGAGTAPSPASPSPSLAGMAISFKLDPRLASGTYGGERWVSPPTYTGAAAQDTVDGRVEGVDAKGRPLSISAKWVPSNPEMVTVSPGEGGQVRIVVKRPGESRLQVSSQGVSRDLVIKAASRNSVMLVEITQLEVKRPAAAPAAPAGPFPGGAAANPPTVKNNKEAGEAFLAANKKKEGVVTLESGLQYKVLKTGEGKNPTLDSTVICQYRRFSPDGTEAENPNKRRKPVSLRMKRAVKGWSEALQLMPVGSKWQLFIPPHLGFGRRGSPRSGIGPNATLIFEVELLAIKEPVPAAGEAPSSNAASWAREN